jgi:GTP-binding protein Era
VSILGRPNAGKSTLMNAMLGERLSIVSPKAQTTWLPVTGIWTEGGSQLVFVDTPGLLSDPADLLQASLIEHVASSVRDSDLAVLVLDPLHPVREESWNALMTILRAARVPVIGVITKTDLARPEQVDRERERVEKELLGALAIPVSAVTGHGMEALVAALREGVPEGPFLYPEDEIATAPVRFFVGELVRETVFESMEDELPWSIFARVEDFRDPVEPGGRTYIGVTLHVEKASQKGMLIGERGTRIREIGTVSRGKIEAFLGVPVYLDLWVKVLPRWRKKRGELRRMGFNVPREEEGS